MTQTQLDRYFALMTQRTHTREEGQELLALAGLRRHHEPHRGFQEHRYHVIDPQAIHEQAHGTKALDLEPRPRLKEQFAWFDNKTKKRGGLS